MTSADIVDLIMDFRPYLNGLQRQFDESGLSSYYITTLTSSGESVEAIILEWLEDPDAAPLAILGSYGTGKTTLAKRMASVLASKALAQRGQRIPILLRLGDISSEQSLEGLLGKTFTAHSVVRNYAFGTFTHLNNMGRFVIFLDGFDEMKHSLSWAELKYNLRQLNRLITATSKIILLGRPTVFLSDEEYISAIKGVRLFNGKELKEPNWPNYRELQLAGFSHVQARLFLKKYLGYKQATTTNITEKVNIETVFNEKIDRIIEGKLSDISRRPMQLQLLAEILPGWEGQVEDLTVASLYRYFIDLIIEREQEKAARLRFGLENRRAFARDLAMFLWLNKGGVSIVAENIPTELIAKHCDPEDDIEAAKRDLISACFLDRKLGDSLFFPHRSFQEFLVAEALIHDLKQGHRTFSDASGICNEEIIEFMEGIVDLGTLRSWEDRFERSAGTLSQRFAELWLSPADSVGYLWDRLRETDSPWYPALLTLAAHTDRLEKSLIPKLATDLLANIEGSSGRYPLVCLWCILLLADPANLGPVLSKITTIRSRYQDEEGNFVPEASVVEFFDKLEVSARPPTLKIRKAYRHLLVSLNDYCLIGEKATGGESRPFAVPIALEIPNPRKQDILAIRAFKTKYHMRKPRRHRSAGFDGYSGPGGFIR